MRIRWQKVLKPGLIKGPWTEEVCVAAARQRRTFLNARPPIPQEDATVRALVAEYGTKKWSQIASQLPGRLGKQCRER